MASQFPASATRPFQGAVTLLNVWASWCVPCHDEAPFLEQLSRDKRIQLVGINYKDTADNARRFLYRYGNPFVATGRDETGRASIDWGVYGVPETFLIGRDGRIAYKLGGADHCGEFGPYAFARNREGVALVFFFDAVLIQQRNLQRGEQEGERDNSEQFESSPRNPSSACARRFH